MRIEPPPRREPGESIVPMINVVFLLLIFFLMTAQIAPPEPFELALPEAEAPGDAAADLALYIGPDGALFHDGAQGDAALTAAAMAEGPLPIRADGGLEAAALARILSQLASRGASRVEITVAAP